MSDQPPVSNRTVLHMRQRRCFAFDILSRMPNLYGATLIVPLVFALLAHLMPGAGTATEVARRLTMVDIITVSTWLTCWSLLTLVTVGCIVVHIMKGPVLTADPYPMPVPEDDPRDATLRKS